MRNRLTFLFAFLAVVFSPAQAAEQTVPIHPGETIRGELPPGRWWQTKAVFELEAATPGQVSVSVRSLEFNAFVSAFRVGADGSLSAVGAGFGEDLVADDRLIFSTDGLSGYRIEVMSDVDRYCGGHFELSVVMGTTPPPAFEAKFRAAKQRWQAVLALAEERKDAECLADALLLDPDLLIPSREDRPAAERVLALTEKALGPHHPLVARSLMRLSWVVAHDSLEEAKALASRALAILEARLGADDPDVATSLEFLGLLHRQTGSFSEAELLLERALAINKERFGPASLDVVDSMDALAMLLVDMGDYARAKPLEERTLAIQEKEAGPDAFRETAQQHGRPPQPDVPVRGCQTPSGAPGYPCREEPHLHHGCRLDLWQLRSPPLEHGPLQGGEACS